VPAEETRGERILLATTFIIKSEYAVIAPLSWSLQPQSEACLLARTLRQGIQGLISRAAEAALAAYLLPRQTGRGRRSEGNVAQRLVTGAYRANQHQKGSIKLLKVQDQSDGKASFNATLVAALLETVCSVDKLIPWVYVRLSGDPVSSAERPYGRPNDQHALSLGDSVTL